MERNNKLYTYHTCYSSKETTEIKELFTALYNDWINNKGFIYVEFKTKQRKGSIARLVCDKPSIIIVTRPTTNVFSPDYKVKDIDIDCEGTCEWTGKSTKVKTSFCGDVTWLIGYKGPTIWKCVNAAKEREKALKIPFLDVKGNTLNLNDKVLYVNASCGTPFISWGKISSYEAHHKRFDCSTHTYVVVEDASGVKSRIKHPNKCILKI